MLKNQHSKSIQPKLRHKTPKTQLKKPFTTRTSIQSRYCISQTPPLTSSIRHQSILSQENETKALNPHNKIQDGNSTSLKKIRKKADGSITLLMGPMFSGKTTQLLNLYREHQENPHNKVLLIKHSSDTRYNGTQEVVSHANSRESAIAVQVLADPMIMPLIQDKTHVFIDEGQFFTDLDVMADKFANQGKKVYIAALDGTFQREPFGVVSKVISRAENIQKLLSECHLCGDDAPFSKRFSNETEVCVIGGKDKYKAVCRSCYFEDAI